MTVTYSGPLPADLDVRLARRDASALPGHVILRLQAIRRGKSPIGNRRYELTESGELFEAGRSTDTSDWQLPFDEPWPSEASRRLPSDRLGEIRRLLEAAFLAEPEYQADETVEDGVFLVVTARTPLGIHEAIYEAVRSDMIAELVNLVLGGE